MQACRPRNESVIQGCMTGAVQGTGMAVGELWRRTVEGDIAHFECLHIAVPDDVLLPAGMPGQSTDGKKHPLSKQLCQRATLDKSPLWFTTASDDKVLCKGTLVKTAVVIPLYSYELQQEMYTVFFSLRVVPSNPTTMALLREVSKAVVMACGVSLEDVYTHEEPSPDKMDTSNTHVLAPPSSRVKLNDISVIFSRPVGASLISLTDLGSLKRVDEGGSAAIYTATYNQQTVCVKMLTEECDGNPRCVKDMRGEVEVLAALRHPNIVRYIASGQEPRLFAVMEYLSGGSLNERLGFATNSISSKKAQRRRWGPWRANGFALPVALRGALQLASALAYMHDKALPEHTLVHRDLKPDNIGFSGDGTLKLIDFGLAKAIPRDVEERATHVMTGQAGSMRYMAPEVVLNKPYDEKADVYSFSIIVYEMASGVKPFADYLRSDFIRLVARQGDRPEPDPRWPPEFTRLLKECWSANAASRPSMRDVEARLKKVAEALQPPQAQGTGLRRWAMAAMFVGGAGGPASPSPPAPTEATEQ